MNRSAGSVALPRVDPPHPAASSPSAVAAASHPIAIDLVGFRRAKPSHTSHTGLPTPSSLPAQPVCSHQYECAVQPPQLPPCRPSDSGGSVQPQLIAVDARSRPRSRSRPRAAVTAAATAATATTADDSVTRRNGAAARPAAPTTPPSSSDESTIDDDLASLPGALFVMEDLELASTSSSSSSSSPAMPHPLDRAQPSPAAPPSSGSPGARAAPVTMAPPTFGWAPNGPAATYERLTGPDRSSGSTTRVSADATSPPATSSSTLSSSYPYPSPRSAPTPSAFSSNIVIRRTPRARYSQHVEPAPASMQVQVSPSRGRHPAAIPLATSDVASRPATPSISVKRAYDEVSPTTGSTPPAMPVDAEMHDVDDDSAAPGRSPSPFSGSDDSANMAPLPAWHTCESQRANVSGRSSTFSLESSRTGRNSPATLRRRSPISASISSVRPASTVTSGHAYLDPYDEVGLDRLGISRDRSKRRRSATTPHSEGSERSSPSTPTAPATSGTAVTTFAPALGRYVPRPIPIDPVLVAEPWPAPPSLNVRGAAAASPASSTLTSSSNQTMSFREELESQFSNLRPSVTLSMPSSTIPTIAARAPATDASSSEPLSRRSVGGFTRFWQAGSPTGPISSNASTMATSSAVTIPVTAGARDWSTTPPTLSLRTRAARSSTFPQTLPPSTAPSQVMDHRWMVDDLSSTRAHVADAPDSTTTNAREVLQRATERLERAEATMTRVLGATTPSTLEERIFARRQSRLNFHLSPPAGNESSGEDTEMNLNPTTRAASEGIWASSPSDGEGSSSGGGNTTAPASADPPTTTTSRTRYFLTNLRARRPRLARNSTGVPSPEVMSSERERSGWLDDLRDEGAVSTSQVSVVAPALWGEEQSQSPQRLDVPHAGAIDSASSSMAPRRMRGPTERANERWRLGQAPVTAQTTTTNVTASATGLNTPSSVRESSYRLGPRSSTTHTLGQRATVATEGPTRTLPWRSMEFRSTTTAPRTTENGTSGGDLATEIRRRYNTLREADSTIPTPVRRLVDPEITPWEDARSSDLSEDSTVSGGLTLPRPERVAPFALTPRLAPPRHRPARGLGLSSMSPSLDSGNDSREVEAHEARVAAALRPSALPPMLSSGSRGQRPTHGSNDTRLDDLPRFDPFGSDAVDTATGSRSNRPALLAAMRASSQLAQGTTAHRSRTSLAEALTRYDAARLADEREQDDLWQRRAEEGAIDDTARRYVIEETEWERGHDDDDDPGSDVDMELWRPDVRRTFGEEVAAGRSRWVRAEMEASAESEQRARQAQERLRSRSEALAALRRDRGQMRHLMGNLTAPLTSGLSGPSITRTTTTTTTTSASPPTSTTTVNTVGAARDAGDQATPRSPGTRRRGLSDFFRGVGATAHFGTSLFDDDSLLAFFGRDSVALDPRNYLADDLFDSSYDALLRLSEQLGDVVKPKGVPEDKLAALRTFKYKAWPIPERRDASNSPSMATTISTVPVASTSTSRPFGSTMVDPVIVPALARKGLEKEERCSVCLMDYDDDDECMLGMCAHGFHRECLLAWLKEHGTCPVCRRDHA